MDSEGILLSEISQTKTNTLWYYLFVDSKKIEPTSEDNWKEAENNLVITTVGEIKGGRVGGTKCGV